MFEHLMRMKNSGTYFSRKYLPARSRLLESRMMSHLRHIFDDASLIEEGVYYRDSQGRRYECDGLIRQDDRLFVAEAKSGGFPSAALRGAPTALKNSTSELVGDPFRQAQRLVSVLEKAGSLELESADGSPLGTLVASEISQYIMIGVTMAEIGHLSTRTHLDQPGIGVIDGSLSKMYWNVFINDLRVVSELLDDPSEFMLFMERRLDLLQKVPVRTIDELDFLAWFLADGMYVDPDSEIAHADRVSAIGLTEPIERYFDSLAGRVTEAVDKPRLPLSDWYRHLVRSVASSGAPGCSIVGKVLLSFDSDAHDKIETFVRRCSSGGDMNDGDWHSFTISSKGPNTDLLVIVAAPTESSTELERHRAYLATKAVQIGCRDAGMVVIRTDRGSAPELATSVWADPISRRRVTRSGAHEFFRRHKLDEFLAANGQLPGRNQDCPCNSGKKFKRCCLPLFRGT